MCGATSKYKVFDIGGDYGVQPLMLPRANATSSENPWRIYMNIRPAVSGLVVMQAADLYRATTK